MTNSENPITNSWERIQDGVKETERLIGQKQYNTSMIKARQTLEYMVKCLCEKSGTVESGLIDMIDDLYESEAISKNTCEHYHKIRTIGNKAIHEEDNSAYNANQAYHLLSQEVYTFANDYGDKKRHTLQSTAVKSRPSEASIHRQTTRHSSSRRRKARSSGLSIDPGSLLKPLLLIAIIVVLIFIIKMIRPGKNAVKETTAPVTTEAMTDSASSTEESSTDATVAAVMYKTIDTVNVRSVPSTDTTRIGVLNPGTEVEYVSDYDEKWCIIKYKGQDAYVSKEFVQPVQ
ncbi:MAG: SH3 domain-containing protein [Clostridium sp.]